MYNFIVSIVSNFKQNSFIYILVVFTIIVILNICFETNFSNIKDIIKGHWNIFRNSKGKIPLIILINYIFFPILISIGVSILVPVNDDILDKTLVIYSILLTMLFTTLTLLTNFCFQVKNEKIPQNEIDLRVLVKETYYTVMYEILKALIIILLCFINSYFKSNVYVFYLYSFIFYYIIITFILNLGIVMRRIFKIFDNKLEL